MASSIFNNNKKAKSFNVVGARKNKTIVPEFAEICKKSQNELKKYLEKELLKFYDEIIVMDGGIVAKGKVPVALTAHLDTVHKEQVKVFYEKQQDGKHLIWSPQGIGGDDRCGVWMIMQVLKSGILPTIIFCEEEEKGGVGSKKITADKEVMEELKYLDIKYMIELDRANADDAVYYEYDTSEPLTKWIEQNIGYKESYGTFSDCCNLAPALDIAAVNLSCGYYNAHTTDEYVVIEEMQATLDKVKYLLGKPTEIIGIFPWKEQPYYKSWGYGYGSYGTYGYYNRLWDDDYDGYYANKAKTNNSNVTTAKPSYILEDIMMEILYKTKDGKENTAIVNGETDIECFGQFFINHPDICYNDILDFYEY